MKILVLNGSPRKGNSVVAINALVEGIGTNHEVEIVDTYSLNIAPCKGCNACGCVKGCVDKDDTNAVVDKVVAADMIVWSSPVYWWGITGQLKIVLDKCYSKGAFIKNKKIGLIIVGGASTTDGQYDLIRSQFACIEKYLGWEAVFFQKFSASAKGELAENAAAMEEMKAVGAAL